MARGRLRVVAGTAGGRRLESPPGAATRPTTERVREAVFSALGAATVGATVLDLYAGTGAMGIEALSRGAAAAVLVERAPDVAAVCRRNLAATGFTDMARVVARRVERFVTGPPPAEAPFGLVCCDPPYETPDAVVDDVLEALAAPGWVAPGAPVVVERAASSGPRGMPAGWEVRFRRAYGDTLVTLLRVGAPDRTT